MVVKNDFFDSKNNRTGKGVEHNYEQQVKENAIIIVDAATGLTWLKTAGHEQSISGAADYIQQLNTKKYASYSNWRFPTLQEAMALVEQNAHEKLHIDPIFSTQNISSIWTSDFRLPSEAWVVDFYYANFRTARRAEVGRSSVLAVRKAPNPSS